MAASRSLLTKVMCNGVGKGEGGGGGGREVRRGGREERGIWAMLIQVKLNITKFQILKLRISIKIIQIFNRIYDV